MKASFIKHKVIACVTGFALFLGTSGLASAQDQNSRQDQRQQNKDEKNRQKDAGKKQKEADKQQQQKGAQDRQQQLIQQQRLTQYNQQRQEMDRLAQQREQALREQQRQAHLSFQQQYQERLRQDQADLHSGRSYEYAPPSYRYSRGGKTYHTNQYGVDMLRQAVNYGYEQGVRAGRADREDRARFGYKDAYAYQDATYGYNGYHVDLNEYRYYFRQGYDRGYQDGYYGRFQYGRESNGAFGMLGDILDQIFRAQHD